MLTVHHLNNSRSQRVLWLLEELGLDYTIKRYERDTETMFAPPALREVHPLGKSPVITDGALTLAESGAIVEYLVGRYGADNLSPAAGTEDHVRYLYWLHYAEGSAMPPLLLSLIFSRIPQRPMPFFIRPVVRRICGKVQNGFVQPLVREHLMFMQAELETNDWFAGSAFSAADIQMSFPLEAAAARASLTAERYPRLHAFLDRIHARPAYQTALERGGPYELLTL